MIALGAVDGMRSSGVASWNAFKALKDAVNYLFSRVQTGHATLTNGTCVVQCGAVMGGAKSSIQLSLNTPSGTPGYLYAPTVNRLGGFSFTVYSTSATDNSTFDWTLTNP